MIRILHVEDDPWIRKGLGGLFRSTSGLSVVGSCASAGEALATLENGLDFEVAVVDLGLPDRPGAEVICAVRRLRPRAAVLAFTVFDDAATIFEALKAGATGYLLKDTPHERLVSALNEALAGGAPMTPSVARLVVDSFSKPPELDGAVEKLTVREHEVLTLLARGESYARIGEALGVELSTIQGHVKAIYRKLEVRSKAEATAVALTRGLVRVQ